MEHPVLTDREIDILESYVVGARRPPTMRGRCLEPRKNGSVVFFCEPAGHTSPLHRGFSYEWNPYTSLIWSNDGQGTVGELDERVVRLHEVQAVQGPEERGDGEGDGSG